MKNKITPRTMPGFLDLLPADQIVFNKMRQIIQDSYESFGFVPMDTPVLELSEILLAKAGGETEKQIYRFTKGDTDMCLRFDLTVPLSRFVAEHQNDLTFPFRRYQIGKSYRGERPQRGRFREFYQADVDIIGNGDLSVQYDIEIPYTIYHTFVRLGLTRFKIHMNNRKLLNGYFESLNLIEKSADILRIIDKWTKIGRDAVVEMLTDLGLTPIQTDAVIRLLDIEGTNKDILRALDKLGVDNDVFCVGLDELKIVVNGLLSFGVPDENFQVDLKITRGLDYYTGMVFETFLNDHADWGSVGGGGRYDNLTADFTDKSMPGVGMSIGLSRFFAQLDAAGMINKGPRTLSQALVLPMVGAEEYSRMVGRYLRQGGVRMEFYNGSNKFKNKMAYADKLGVPFVVIVGEDEAKNQTATLKDMVTGEQESTGLDGLADRLLKKLASKPSVPLIREG